MEHHREFKEKADVVEDDESPEVHKNVVLSVSDPTPPTRDVLIQSRGRSKVREMGATISASLGAMRPLIGKLDMLLLRDAPWKCSSKRVMDGMRLLKDDVEKISSYLDELSEVEDPPPTAMCWMNEARDLSYDIEDYIDSLLFVPSEEPSLVTKSIKATISLCKWTQVISAERLSEFRMYVQEAIQRHQRYNLHSCRTLRRRFVSLGPMLLPTPYEGTADIVIDGRMNEFINSLANDGDQQLKALSVFGSACLGKTTLARVLYNRFGKQYSYRAFIRVSKKPDMKRIFRDMLSQLQRHHPPRYYMEIDLIHNIKQYLQDQRYLILIDDVWAGSVWDIINHALPKGNHGSRIITTTQIEDVALTCCCYQSEYVFEMKHLDDDHSRKLFFNRLFGSKRDCPQQFKEVLNDIVEICDGLPLATISIASLLANQPVMSIDLLKYIHQSLSFCFSASEITRHALKLSFNNLPHYLKTCLIYLGMYREGYTFCKDDLVRQWIAEGFIGTTEGQDVVKVAESYLDQLIGRRFIRPIRINYKNDVLLCAVHDMVHDLITHKSSKQNFIVGIDYNCGNNVALSHKVRRLSLHFGSASYAKTPEKIRKSQVRSLRFFGLSKCMPCLKEFKLLRVLNLHISYHGGNKDPCINLKAISKLFQLRYLKIACNVRIILPSHGLQCLETLDISMEEEAANVNVACRIKLPHLLHLSLHWERDMLDWYVGLGRFGKLNYLQDLHLTIPSANNLERSMETLGFLIGGHRNLKSVVVVCLSSVEDIVVPVSSQATISWDGLAAPILLQQLEFSPHSRIIFSRIPIWVKELVNLRILKIPVKEIYCLEILRGLPALTALSLYLEKAPLHMIIFDSAAKFSVLEYFKFRCTTGIAWLKFEADAMPNLWKLKLVFNAIPAVDQHLYSSDDEGTFKRRQLGAAVISIEHKPGLKEIIVKIGGAAADVEYASRAFVSNHPRNPKINMQTLNYSPCGEESTQQKPPQDEILMEEPSGSNKQQPADEILETEPDKHDSILHKHKSSHSENKENMFLRYPLLQTLDLARAGAGVALNKGLGYFGWGWGRKLSHPMIAGGTLKEVCYEADVEAVKSHL